jgi:hypothetical protein
LAAVSAAWPATAQDFAVGGRAVFDRPEVNGVALDWCVTWGTDCGQAAADRYCQTQGYGRSIGYLSYAPGRTYVPGDGRTCEGHLCGGLLRVECDMPVGQDGGGAAKVDFRNFLFSAPFEWIDNGRSLGTIAFMSDGSARATWIDVPQRWAVDPNGDLMIHVDGTRWVVRLRFDPVTGTFGGTRDVTSQTQDGVQTVMRAASPTQGEAGGTGASAIQLFAAVPLQPSDAFKARRYEAVAIETTAYDRTPYHMTSGPYDGTITVPAGRRVFLAGDAAGKAPWGVDNFLLFEIASGGETRRFVVGGVDPVSVDGMPVPSLGPSRFQFGAEELELTSYFTPGVPSRVTASALDYGGQGYVSDVFLIVR